MMLVKVYTLWTMNAFQQTLYDNLMAICATTEAFYYVDQDYEGDIYRIFLYRLASYTDFQLPNALECRGHTFRITNGVELVCMPMEKFFNLGENPSVINLDLSVHNIDSIMDKLDGSLISTAITRYGLRLKTKGSFFSEQSVAATALLQSNYNTELREYCNRMAANGYTVNMEYTSPSNRIVLGYDDSQLRVLNVRNNENGKYLPFDEIAVALHSKFIVPVHKIPVQSEEWINSIYGMTGIEGFVINLKNGPTIKVKCDAYCVLHKTKDSISSERKLFEACVMETADDLRGLFKDDQYTINLINTMEVKVSKLYNHISVVIEKFYNENKHLDRKTYAILGQNTSEITDNGVFGLVMNVYVGKPYDLKEFMIKNYTKFGIRDITYELPE